MMQSDAGCRLRLLCAWLVTVGLTAGCGDSSTEASRLTSTFLSISSPQGDWVGGGQNYYYTVQSGDWSIEPAGPPHPSGVQQIDFHYSGGGLLWRVQLAAPYGEHLKPGRYRDVQHASFRSNIYAPGLEVSNGRACNQVTGEFTIHEIRVGTGNRIERLHVEFLQSCEGFMPPLTGELAVLAHPWR